MEFSDKKIPVAGITISFLLIIYSILTKGYDPTGDAYLLTRRNLEVPLEYYEVDFMIFKVGYLLSLFILFIIFGTSIYLLLFSNDQGIRSKVSNLSSIPVAKYLAAKEKINKWKGNNKKAQFDISPAEQVGKTITDFKIPPVSKRIETPRENFLRSCILVSLFWTFYVSISTGFYLSFFIPLSFYYYMKLRATSKKDILLKSIFYPLGFGLFLAIFAAAIKMSNHIYEMSFGYFFGGELAKVILPVILCSAITYATLKKKMKRFDFKINWVFLSVVITTVLLGSGVLYAQYRINSFDYSDYFQMEEINDLDLKPYVGMNMDHEEFDELLTKLDSDPLIRHSNNAWFYDFQKDGIAFNINSEGNIHMIFLYSGKGEGEHQQFTGVLPYSLDFEDSKLEVEKKLGKAEDRDGEENWWWSKRINVSFSNGKIDNIVLF